MSALETLDGYRTRLREHLTDRVSYAQSPRDKELQVDPKRAARPSRAERRDRTERCRKVEPDRCVPSARPDRARAPSGIRRASGRGSTHAVLWAEGLI